MGGGSEGFAHVLPCRFLNDEGLIWACFLEDFGSIILEYPSPRRYLFFSELSHLTVWFPVPKSWQPAKLPRATCSSSTLEAVLKIQPKLIYPFIHYNLFARQARLLFSSCMFPQSASDHAPGSIVMHLEIDPKSRVREKVKKKYTHFQSTKNL